MGAFLLCKKVNKTEDIERGLLAFKEKGFEAPSEFQLGDYRLFSFQKQLVPGQKNTRNDGRAVLVSVGTPVYKQKSYADTLDAVFEDLKTGQFEYARMYGSFVLLFYDGNQIRFVLDDMRQRVGSMLESMNYIVMIVLVCAGAPAFIVLYNLTNISINERRREIATLKVLGFYPRETAAYVFRENMVLTGISALFGLPMGYALLWYVMEQIKISSFYFPCRAAVLSYIMAVALTFVFAAVVALVLNIKLDNIDMADSLKAVE